jgi:hypothetical protein
MEAFIEGTASFGMRNVPGTYLFFTTSFGKNGLSAGASPRSFIIQLGEKAKADGAHQSGYRLWL